MDFSRLTKRIACILLSVFAALAMLDGGDALAARAKKAPAKRAKTAAKDGAYRVKAGKADLFLPPNFHVVDRKYDVIVHFHGMPRAQEANVTAAGINAAVVSINLGSVPSRYGKWYRSPRALDRILAKTHRLVMASGRAPRGARIGRVALSAWSAGFGAVGAIMKHEKARARVDAVLLADGLHAPYLDKRRHVIEESSLAKYVRLSEEAARGEKLFVLTHSSIPTYGYANVTETVGTVLRLASVEFEKDAPPPWAPRNMRPLYQVNKGDFHVIGYDGRSARDHIDHIWAMGETMYPLLAARWRRSLGHSV